MHGASDAHIHTYEQVAWVHRCAYLGEADVASGEDACLELISLSLCLQEALLKGGSARALIKRLLLKP